MRNLFRLKIFKYKISENLFLAYKSQSGELDTIEYFLKTWLLKVIIYLIDIVIIKKCWLYYKLNDIVLLHLCSRNYFDCFCISFNYIYNFSTTMYIENITGSSESCCPKAVTPDFDPPMAIYLIEFGQKKLSSWKKGKRKIWSESRRSEYPAP